MGFRALVYFQIQFVYGMVWVCDLQRYCEPLVDRMTGAVTVERRAPSAPLQEITRSLAPKLMWAPRSLEPLPPASTIEAREGVNSPHLPRQLAHKGNQQNWEI